MSHTDAIHKNKILFVDDEEATVSAIKVFLELSGFQVVTARNGHEALAHVSATSPDLVILDAVMPQLDGWETLRRLRQLGDSTPVILLLYAKSTQDEALAMHEGANACLHRPLDVLELVTRIREILHDSAPST